MPALEEHVRDTPTESMPGMSMASGGMAWRYL